MKLFKRCCLLFAFLFGFTLLTSCDNSSTDNNLSTNSNLSTNDNKEINLFISDEKDDFSTPLNSKYENEEIRLSFKAPKCRKETNFSLEIEFEITNLTNQTKEYKIKDFKIIREKTNIEYTVNLSLQTAKLEPELTENFKVSSIIPASIQNNNYKLVLEINNYKIIYFLYDKPDELRKDKSVSFFIDDKIVDSIIVKENRTIPENFVYESSDNLYYCNEWYLDQNCKNKFTTSRLIKNDTILYGKLKSCFKWDYCSNNVDFLSKVEHAFSNEILIIPRKHLNNDICLNSYAISDLKVNAIYIPKNIINIYPNNFRNINGASIYFEGSMEEWKTLFYCCSVVTTNVRYNIKYPN